MVMELEESSTPFEPVDDKRPLMLEPPPVRLIAVADCTLPAIAGQEPDLDRFYIALLKFEREDVEDAIVYRAENFRLRFAVIERPITRQDLRPLGITVPSLAGLIEELRVLEIDFEHLRGLTVGAESILMKDPAGNLVQIGETQRIL
jgi:hypothetical protein